MGIQLFTAVSGARRRPRTAPAHPGGRNLPPRQPRAIGKLRMRRTHLPVAEGSGGVDVHRGGEGEI